VDVEAASGLSAAAAAAKKQQHQTTQQTMTSGGEDGTVLLVDGLRFTAAKVRSLLDEN
jgi:hypothetical protein